MSFFVKLHILVNFEYLQENKDNIIDKTLHINKICFHSH